MKRFSYIMFVCACALFVFVGNASAQIKSDDIVTISYKVTDRNGNVTSNYLYANGTSISDKPTYDESCLWKITISGTNYSFQNVKTPTNYLYTSRSGSTYSLTLGENASIFTFDGSNVNNVAQGTLSYRFSNNNTRYIRFSNNNFQMSSTNNSNSLTIEKWELKSEKGEVKITATANPTTITFDEFVDDDTAESKDITVTVSSAITKEKEYYQNLNNSSQTIFVSEGDVESDATFEISNVSAIWSSNANNNIYSSTNCEVFGESASTKRNLLKIESVTPSQDNKSCTISISTVGNSPMEMKNGEKWKDYSDILVVAFRNADPNIDATYRAYIDVTRYSFHQEELPEFQVKTNLSDNNILFSKGGDEEIINISCVHQHGASILHYSYDHDGTTEIVKEIDKIYEVEPTTITDLTFAQFAAKSIIDETNVDWVTLSHSANGPSDGKLTLSVEENATNIARSARLVGQFNYQCPANSEVTHSAILQIPITQNAKDGDIKFVHNKGIYNTQFGTNPYTQEDEQLVHTAEKIIYYQSGTDITLNLPEKRFQGYKRWYDYKTGDDPAYNANATDRAAWVTAPQGTRINNEYGDTYGIYDTNNRAANTPIITASWTDNKEHIIACDLSNYKDYDTDNPAEITEPTLSYRQLFRLRPAEWIADTLTTMSLEGKYFEVHNYMAPTGENIYLATNYHHSLATATDNNYFYYNANNQLARVSGARWYKDGVEVTGTYSYDVKDYFKISSNTEGTIRYELRVPGKLEGGKDVLIAQFVVTFVSPTTHGPTTTEIISRDKILSDYVMLEEINFNYSPLPTSNTANQQLYHPLSWDESTYGYYYPDDVLGGDEMYHQHTNRSGNKIPYTGEYFLVNSLNLEWADQDNRGGANQGYVLYVDGAEEPGLVASISTDATVCSGQTMYCSMWLCNPSRERRNGTYCDPIFRCNIQGRNAGDSDWTDVGVYFVGDLPWGASTNTGGLWHQVKFPIDSEVSYDETRVQIYNFGTGESGNDFMVDDICLFVSPFSLAAYQATMGCHSYTGVDEASTAVVVRVDYARLNQDLQNRFVYYRLFNTTDNKVVKLKTLSANNEVVSAYYAEDSEHISEEYGSIKIPADDYIPTTGAGDNIQTSLASYMNNLMNNNLRHGKCYVKDANNNWYLYLMHIIPNTQSNVYGQDEDIYLVKDKDYLLAIANDYNELDGTECSSTTELHATTDTYVELHDADGGVERVDCRDKLCANNQYFLDVKVENTLATGIGGNLETLVATVHADWLIGEEFDDVYCTPRSMSDSIKGYVDTIAFKSKYGCTRNDLRDAIGRMRQVPSDKEPNPNYSVSDASQLQVTSFFNSNQKELIKRLCAEGKLSLYKTSVRFYMGSNETVRYWVYPIAEDATVTFNGTPYTLYDCDEPKWIKLTSDSSEYALNLSPINKEDQTSAQRLDIPSVRILEGTEQVTVPIKQLIGDAKLNSALAPTSDEITFRYDAVVPGVLEYIEFLENRIAIVDAPEQLEPGKDYLMRIAFYNADGQAYDADCRVGFAYFYLSIVPKKVEWTGQFNNDWGDDRNWQGVKEDGSLMEGYAYAPLPETNVIIRADKPVPIITATDAYPMDVNHHPNACNKIYFEPDAMIHNQHLLEYNEAYVDMKIQAANWNSMAPPLKGMYTGDMFVPHVDNNNAEYKSITDHGNYPFAVSPFQGARTSKAPYVFWQSLYNKRATIYHENGNQSHPALTTTAIFAQTNSLGQPLPPGTGYQVLGFGPQRNELDEIIVRLPKPDTYYSYYYSNGTVSDQHAYVEHSSKLAFEPDANGDMYITLTNDLPSSQFMFGNPTMTNIDMQKFLDDPYNKAKLAQKYYTMSNSSWKAETWATAEHSGSGELAPMRSVLLELASGDATSITVKLSKTHLVGYTEPAPAGVVARKNVAEEELGETQLMTIYATSEGGQARCMLASNAYAHDIYDNQEDALFISSGVEEGVNSATATSPVNMYTVSEQVPMMVDVRENIDTVPLSMLVHDSYRTEKVQFAFYLSLNWDKECYFCDAVTGKRYRIMDGLWLEMDMPQNHEVRYFIDGPDVIDPDNGGDIWSSTEDVKTSDMQVWAYSPSQGELVVASNDIIKEVTVYDIAGRVIAHQTLNLQYSSMTIATIPGVCIVETTLRDNTKHYTQTVVR